MLVVPIAALTLNVLLLPLLGTCLLALVALGFWIKVRRETQRAAQQQTLGKLKPPRKGHNHRSLPVRQYYLTRNLARATPAEELLLEVYVKLHPAEAAGSGPR